MPLVPGCPEPLAINAVRNASVDFCCTTLWWQDDYGPISFGPHVEYHDFVPPYGVGIAQIMSARLVNRGYPLTITSIQEMDNRLWNWRAATGEPRAIYQDKPGVVRTYPRPEVDTYDIMFRLALTPLRNAVDIDESVYDSYLTEIAAGALEILLGMESTPWANPGLGGRYGSDFRSALVAAATETNKSYGRQNQRVLMRHG
jgi:hypothetical protein